MLRRCESPGADDELGLVHSMVVIAANVVDITQVNHLLHSAENEWTI